MLPLLATTAALLTIGGTAAVVRGVRRPPTRALAFCMARGLPYDSETLGRPVEEQTLELGTLYTGRRLTSTAMVVDGDRPTGPTVLVVHGHTGSRQRALALADAALPHAARMVTFDLPAHGDAGRDDTGRVVPCNLGLTEPVQLAAALAEVSAMAAGPVVVVASSLGSQSMLHAAARHLRPGSHRLDGMVLIAAYRTIRGALENALRLRGMPAWPCAALSTAALGALVRLEADAARRGSLPHVGFDRIDDAPHIDVPTLYLHGSDDRLTPLAGARALAEATPDAELTVLEGGAHSGLSRSHPAVFNQAVGAFLRRFGT